MLSCKSTVHSKSEFNFNSTDSNGLSLLLLEIAILSVKEKSVYTSWLHCVDAVYWSDIVPITPVITISIQSTCFFNILTC